MTILGLDAGLGGFSAAITHDGEKAAAVDLPGQVALEQGLAAVTAALRKAGKDPAQVDRIAVGIGPGSFTGVRIAISYAKSLALGWRRPLTGVNSFDALEAGVPRDPRGALLTVVQGRPGVISVRLRTPQTEQRASGYVRDVLDELAGVFGKYKVSVLGDAEGVIAALGERGVDVHVVDRVITPAALAVATVAATREPAHSLHEIRADYGELPAAKIPKLGGAHGESSK